MYVREILPDVKFAEIYSSGLEFALFANQKSGLHYTQLHPFVLCKDFISDYLWSEATKKPASIYGFSHKPDGSIPTGVLIRLKKDEHGLFGTASLKVPQFLAVFERAIFGAAGSKCDGVYDIQNDGRTVEKNMIAVFLHPQWFQSTQHISLATLLIRVAISWDMKTHPKEFMANLGKHKMISSHDASYCASISKKLDAMFDGSWKPKLKFSDLESTSAAHNAGICGYDNYEKGAK